MAEQLKNVYTKQYLENLALKIKNEFKEFNEKAFCKAVLDDTWQTLELKQRMRHIALCLDKFLPFSYKEQLDILKTCFKRF